MRLGVGSALVGAVLSLVLAACGGGGSAAGSSAPSSPAAPPSSASATPASSIPGASDPGAQTVQLKVVKGPGGAVLALIPVMIDGQGPFAFALDTGASKSAIDVQVAKKLKLPNLGAAGEVTGVAKTSKAELSQVKQWQIGGVTLPPTDVITVDLGGQNTQAGLAGLLGSDVLNRFGAVTVDYDAQKLVLQPHVKQQLTPSPSTPIPTQPGSAVGPPRPIPLKIVSGPGNSVLALVPVGINNQGPFAFALDTGASNSTIDSALAKKLGLPDLGPAGKITGVAAMTQGTFSEIQNWQVGNVILPAKRVISVDLGGQNAQAGLAGLLGSDILSQYGAVTVDYDAALLVLRPHVQQSAAGSPAAS